MHCYHCGAQIPDGLKFCVDCGAALDEPNTETRPLVEKKAPEAPVVEQIPLEPAQETFFHEELQEDASADDFPLTPEEAPAEEAEEQAEEAPAEEPEEEAGIDPALDPTSPEFNPRMFAEMGMEEFAPKAAPAPEEKADEEDEAPVKQAGKKQKKGRGGVIALVLILVALILGGAAGLLYWLTEPVKQSQMKTDFVQFMNLPEDNVVEQFTVDIRETSRLRRSDAIWCSVTAATDAVRTQRGYLMQYALTREGWKLRSVNDLNTENWTATPLIGASLEEIYAALTGQMVTVQPDYIYTLEQADAQTAEILSQTPDLDAKTDTVEATISVVDEIVGWTADVELQLQFKESWVLSSFAYDDVRLEFKPGMEFKFEDEELIAHMAEHPILLGKTDEPADTVETTTVVDGEPVAAEETQDPTVQAVTVKEDEVVDFTVEEKRFTIADGTQNVTCKFTLEKPAATLQVNAVLTYVFDDGWKIDGAEYEATVEQIKLDGDWVGTYTAAEGQKPNVKLTVATAEDGTKTNTFAFSAPVGVWFPTGSYTVADTVDLKTLNVKFDPVDWTAYGNPGNITMVGLDGTLKIDEATITDGETFTITLQIPEAVAAEE